MELNSSSLEDLLLAQEVANETDTELDIRNIGILMFTEHQILRELRKNGSPEPEFDMDEDRTYLNTIIHIRDGFEKKETISELMSESMSELMSELERERMQIILNYLEINREINSSCAAELLEVEIKTASRLLLKAEKLDILKSTGKTKNKMYFI